ncbi:alpha/beta fold hydrolase [Pseudoalteromonas sp. OOF1S-7]|uniref:alpha/beta hydrolase n=1 Tax=Pseudoalteromonas sp. OOF1S-7 TaxID=2917757 RepID=UPI001EF64084|nr:alpha/beta fold hydrolase [Pseudoalteromonas sp. OOF1S-7]MCG7537443.1 lysophospholipase [Pseudoalteromonas sp. OOF1S-7]
MLNTIPTVMIKKGLLFAITITLTQLGAMSVQAQTCQSLLTDLSRYQVDAQQGSYRFANETGTAVQDIPEAQSYSAYIRSARAMISARNPKATLSCELTTGVSALLPGKPTQVADYVAPFELTHPNNQRAVLLIHGLTDSPFTFHSLAADLYAQGFDVRTMLLPGHGTAASDLKEVDYRDWKQHVRYAISRTASDYSEFTVLGYSTGAALATAEIAARRPDNLAALVLVAPATQSHSKVAWLAKWLDWLPWVDWVDKGADLDLAKYESFPLHAVTLVEQAMADMREARLPASLPTLVIASDVDATINSQSTYQLLSRWAQTHTAPLALRVYAPTPIAALPDSINVTEVAMLDGVIDMSHIGLLNPPEHTYYGATGIFRNCDAYLDDTAAFTDCKTTDKPYFGERSEVNLAQHRPLVRVSFNPDYDPMLTQLITFLHKAMQ